MSAESIIMTCESSTDAPQQYPSIVPEDRDISTLGDVRVYFVELSLIARSIWLSVCMERGQSGGQDVLIRVATGQTGHSRNGGIR